MSIDFSKRRCCYGWAGRPFKSDHSKVVLVQSVHNGKCGAAVLRLAGGCAVCPSVLVISVGGLLGLLHVHVQ